MIGSIMSDYKEIIILVGFFLFFAIYFTSIKKYSYKGKFNSLLKWSYIFGVLGFITLFIICVSILVNKINKTTVTSPSQSSSADGFTIEEYKIIMNVNESNSIDIKEYITVNFYEDGHHGIYRFIPSWLEYTNKDGVTESRQSQITNLKAIEDQYTIDFVNGKQRIKIGSPNYYLPIGNHIYEIDYTYDMGGDPNKDFDEFIFHAFGDYWGTEIKNASLIINLPKSFDKNKIKFFADKYRKKDITSSVNYNVFGNTINAKLLPTYNLYNSLTIDIELPDNYFINSSNNYGLNSFLLCILCILIALISFIIWIIYGKDLNKEPETVEFYPPENLDAAEVGYLYKKDTGIKLTIALIVELASKGFIKIIDSQDKFKQTIVKSNITDVNKYINREIKIKKLKEYKAPIIDTHYKSTIIMNNYFPKDVYENIVTKDFYNFYEDSKYLIDNGYIEIQSDTINNYKSEELEIIKENLLLNEFKNKPKMTSNEEIVYNRLFENTDETILSENGSFYKTFNEIAENVRNNYDNIINDFTSYKWMLTTSIGFFIGMILFGFSYCIVKDLNPKLNILYYIAFISNFITLLLSILMKRQSKYGENIKAKIKGFKHYIEIAEKNQIDSLAEQNPNYFYDILPYAYVLGVSKKWIEKFENIPTPTKDMGNFDYFSVDSIDNLSSSIYYPSSTNGSSSSGCSSCGGGCSSCGGGCSSCGGGGSW